MRFEPPFALMERAARQAYERQIQAQMDRANRAGSSVMVVPWSALPEADRQHLLHLANQELAKILCDQEDAIIELVQQMATKCQTSSGGTSRVGRADPHAATAVGGATTAPAVNAHQTTKPDART